MKKIHICLVSKQPIPNLIPVLREDTKPDKVYLLVSKDMKTQSQRLQKVINKIGVEVEEKSIEPYELEAARDTCLNLLAVLENEDVTLNVTGGTKIMALAAFEVFRECEQPILYVDTQNYKIQYLSPERKELEFTGVLKVADYLLAYGQSIENEETNYEKTKERRNLTECLIKNIGKFEKAIGYLNSLVNKTLKSSLPYPKPSEKIDKEKLKWEDFIDLLRTFDRNGLFKFDTKKDVIIFSDKDSTEYACGKWIEDFVFQIISEIKRDDLKKGVQVKWDARGKKPPMNEYDVVFTYRNKLYLIECKTKRFDNLENEKTSEPIYKLESLRDAAGGLYGKGMLVSYRKLKDEDKSRLKANQLEYCDGNDLHRLKDKLINWTR